VGNLVALNPTAPPPCHACNNKDDIMSFKVHVGPPQIAIHQGQTVLVSEIDGQITWPSEKGLYFLDTRVVSNWAIYANGEPWELLNGGSVGSIFHQPEVLQQTGRIRTAFPRERN
jgi:hypothetical protein